jgi:glycosyltransferase involved in cell wall biosynthesis
VNIAMVVLELLVEGGGERQMLCLARALGQQGHRVTIYTAAYNPATCFPDICKDLTIVETGRGRFSNLKKPLFLRGWLDMRHMAAKVTDRHDIWNPHHWPGQWGAVWLKRKLGGKVVWMCNDVPIFHQLAHESRSLRAPVYSLYYDYDRRQNREVDTTLFLSRWAESEFRKIYKTNSRVVRSGADPDRFMPGGDREKIRSRFGYSSEDFVLLWLGIFMPHRRVQDAIEAIADLKTRGVNVQLLLAGSDYLFPEYFQSLKTLTKTLGVENEITFAGKVADQEIRDFYCACDAFLFPNENQTWGLAVLEAMACGCPAVVSKGAAVQEVLTDNETAFLFPARAPKELAARIETIIRQPQLRREVAERGMAMVRNHYNWDTFAQQIIAVCQESLTQP